MTWIKEWITLVNQRLLKLEGYDLSMGWHAYVWYGKYKEQSRFMEHIVRKALGLVWYKFRAQTYKKTPLWVAPIEAFTMKVMNQKGIMLTYKELLNREQNIKSKQELEELGVATDWWSLNKLESRYRKDRNLGFFEGEVQVDKLWIHTDE